MCIRDRWWIGVIGGLFAIIVVKMLFGGLGQNFMNPALAARCFLLISFTSIMTNFDTDTYSGATPLASLKAGESVNIYNMVIGKTAGTIGETSMIAIVAGACFLLLLGIIDLRIPGTYIVTFVIDVYKRQIEKKGLVGKILYGSNTCKISRFLLWCKTCGGYGL